MDSVYVLLFVGAVAGITKAFLGYEKKVVNGNEEPFDAMKIIQTAIRASLLGAFIVYNMFNTAQVTTNLYIVAFFTAIGADKLLMDGYNIVSSASSQEPDSNE